MIQRAEIVSSPQFTDFLVEAKRQGYGSPDVQVSRTVSGARVIEYASGPFSYTDTYVGGNPYAGFEHVSYSDGDEPQPVWAMSYYETFLQGLSGTELAEIMSKVLPHPQPDLPLRGPKEWTEGDIRYWTKPVSRSSSLTSFDVEEFIARDGRRLYTARFIGGIVNTL